jgi:hypothetical protein
MSEYPGGITTIQVPLKEAIKKECRGKHEIIVTILSMKVHDAMFRADLTQQIQVHFL